MAGVVACFRSGNSVRTFTADRGHRDGLIRSIERFGFIDPVCLPRRGGPTLDPDGIEPLGLRNPIARTLSAFVLIRK